MLISPFTPLFFNLPKSDGLDSPYIQTFATTDKILLQLIATKTETPPSAILISGSKGDTVQVIEFSAWDINDTTVIYFATLSPTVGTYRVYVVSHGLMSDYFRVTDNELELNDTTLIQYSMRDNRQRTDVVFFIDKMQYFFDWRVPGGFKDSNWSFNVESEQFLTDRADIIQLFGLESTQKVFTLGGSMGVPVWFGEMLNRILVCSHVYFDGVKYSRVESNTPEINVQLDGVNSFVFSQLLQQSVNLDPVIEQRNHLIMRRITRGGFRGISNDINRKI